MTRSTTVGAAVAFALAASLAACGSDDEKSSSSGDSGSSSKAGAGKGPIVIGAAVDDTGFMKPIDQPPLEAAKIQVAKINDAGGVNGRKLEFKVINTQIDPEKTKAAATSLIDESKADVLWVTCDVDLSTPSIQVGLAKKKLTVAPCIGTDQMGPKRFGEAGKLAYSFGNVAQDEGAAMAKAAIEKGWKTANVTSDKQLVYTQNVCKAFEVAFQQLGGKVASTQTFTAGDNTINSVVSKVNGSQADVNTICTTAGKDLPAFVTGIRGLGSKTPILGPWAIDGTYWHPKSAKAADDIHLVTYASVFGDDPDKTISDLQETLKGKGAAPSTGGFITGPQAVDAIAQAVKDNGGKTDGEGLATSLGKLRNFETSTGDISFSDDFHTVTGRDYRVIDVDRGKASFGGIVRADKPVELPAS